MDIFGGQLFTILTSGGIVQGLFVVLLLNHKGVRKSRANVFLSILLIALSFSIFHIQYAEKIIHHLSVDVYSLGDPTFLLIAPLLWFYAVELTGQRVKMSARQMLHFVPFLLVIFISLTFKSVGSETFASFIGDYHRHISSFFWLLVVAQFSIYLFFVHRRWRTHQRLIRQEVSNTENVNISWVEFFLFVFLIINLSFFFSLFATIHLEGRGWLYKTTAAVFSVSVFALSFKGILQRDIFNNTIPPESAEKNNADVPAVSVNRPDPGLIKNLLAFMEEKKPYLDPELTLSSLAKSLNISRSHLSQLINDGIGENFYDFVNKYRVEEVKRLMIDPQVKNFNLLGIALEAGFKSKSTFNLIFKRFTGLTPTEYRKNLSS